MRILAAALLATTVFTAPLAAQAPAARPAPVASLVKAVDIPWQQFTLPNGLRVIVHEDRKAPVVAVSIWYHIGSKDEPAGKTGFAHLFEHLMFNGSENAPGDFFAPLQTIGATDYNGTTWFDRTNYFQTVPTPALERMLFLESDRMGHLLGAVTQENLTNQIGVVQNEKRQGDNQPYGLVEYATLEALFPEGHPYRHSTIGSMADLSGASLEDVKTWFRQHYGPNNAVLVLAGDIDVATAKTLTAKYFGDIPRGPEPKPTAAAVPTLAAPKVETMNDRVATTRLYRIWAVPGLTDPAAADLDVAAAVLGGLSSSRLDNILVRQEKLAVAVSASNQTFERVGQFEVTMDVRPGVDAAAAGKRLDAIIAQFLAEGPTADEVQRVATREVSNRISGLESVGGFGGKAVALAEGALYANDPDFYKKQLADVAAATPAEVKATAAKWLSRPVYALTVAPGERKPYDEAKAAQPSTFAPSYYRTPTAGEMPLAPAPKAAIQAAAQSPARPAGAGAAARAGGVDRSQLPPVGDVAALDFPAIERSRLANGIEVVYAQRDAVPATRVALSFDAGNAADDRAKLGTQSLMLALLDEGTTTRNSIQIAEEQERLGAQIGAGASMDRTFLQLYALTANLQPSLALFADVARNPAFAPAEVERLRATQLARIAAELTNPQGIAGRALPPLLYGTAHPYGVPFSGLGDAASVAKVTRDDLVRFHGRWLRPDTATLYVVSDRPLAEIKPALEATLGDWRAPAGAKGVKNLAAATPPRAAKVVLLDRPQSPQSVIYAGQLLPYKGSDDLDALALANDVLGGTFLSRINMDLRESKGWSYGVNGRVQRMVDTVPYILSAPVQSDQTAPSIVALKQDMTKFLTSEGITAAERERAINNRTLALAGNFETSDDVLTAMQTIDTYKLGDTYYETLAPKYRAMTVAQLDQAARKVIDPNAITWVVVGDAGVVRPQLQKAGIAFQEAKAEAAPAPAK